MASAQILQFYKATTTNEPSIHNRSAHRAGTHAKLSNSSEGVGNTLSKRKQFARQPTPLSSTSSIQSTAAAVAASATTSSASINASSRFVPAPSWSSSEATAIASAVESTKSLATPATEGHCRQQKHTNEAASASAQWSRMPISRAHVERGQHAPQQQQQQQKQILPTADDDVAISEQQRQQQQQQHQEPKRQQQWSGNQKGIICAKTQQQHCQRSRQQESTTIHYDDDGDDVHIDAAIDFNNSKHSSSSSSSSSSGGGKQFEVSSAGAAAESEITAMLATASVLAAAVSSSNVVPRERKRSSVIAKCCGSNCCSCNTNKLSTGIFNKNNNNTANNNTQATDNVATSCQQRRRRQQQQQHAVAGYQPHQFAIQSRLSSRNALAATATASSAHAAINTCQSEQHAAATLLLSAPTTAAATAAAATTTKQRNKLYYYAKLLQQQQQQQEQCSAASNNSCHASSATSNCSIAKRISTVSSVSPCGNTPDKSHKKLRNICTKLALDLEAFSRTLFTLIIIFNMLPLFCAGMVFLNQNKLASNFDTSELRSGPNPVSHPWIPAVAYLVEPLPRPTKSPKCDQTFVSRIGGPQNGSFSAPLLHNHKNHSRQCLYTFLAGPGQRVEVLFTTFNLRGSPPDGSAVGELPTCVHEYMDIYSEVQSSDPAELINSPFGGRYCGAIPPRRRISMYRAIAISFFTNKNVTSTDLFEGTFRFINASEYEIGIPIAGSPCSYTITPSMSINKTGALISPTYPGAYPKDMSCTYQFLGESNQRVRLEFRDFDLFFGGPHCPFDYVKVYDGPDNSSALIGTYCGQQRNLVLYSSESSLFVHFYTLPRTANTQNRGFKGIYEFSESFVKLDFIRENDGIHIRGSECDQKILSKKESTGFVLSPNYPYPYIPKTVCRYFIYGMQDAQHLERVRLEFSAFNIPKVEHKDKSESNCTDGYLKIYLKGQETADAYDKFDYELCGNETQRVVSEGPRLAMVFSSGELQGRGFKGKYIFETEYKIPGTAAPDGSCSFTYVSNSKKRGELNSPRYPSNYPSETNCSYLFLGESNEQVTIVFDHFKVKADGNANATAGAYGSGACFEDWLEMYVVYRDNNDRFLGRYCGLTAPGPVESPRGAVGLRITLHTDQENVASGFKARYFFEAAKSDAGDCGGNFSNEDSGIITSPNYPSGYKAPGRGMASMACNWIMTARPGYKLSINFEQFSIEGDPANRGCPAAVLRLWVNVDSDQPPMELCGEKPPVEQWHYISTGQTARISFTTSDKTVGAQGFRIVWTEIQDSGPGPPSIGLLCESTYHFQCEVGYCISDKLRCDGIKNCGPGDDSDELHCITEAPEEDHGVLIIITLVVVSFLICLLCTLCHSRRKRRNHVRQLGLHRNAHYDSQTSATVGLSSSRRHLQSGASISGSLHGINSGNLMIPPAPLPPTSVPPPPHICIAASLIDDDDLDLDDDDDDDLQHEIFINDVRFDEENMEDLSHLENV